MRTITLEILRHGPAHNQLLSPLTEYLGLCENHSAVTIRMPFEHNEALYRLRALSYGLGEEARQFQVNDTAQVLSALLADVPGLTADMNRHARSDRPEAITHLRLILSASELALMPFELAIAPPGCPGAGQFLLLQPHAPICITRETRRVPEEFTTWPAKPKVLVVIASPEGFEPVPAAAHVLALRKLLEPWIGSSDDDSTELRQKNVMEYLTVLPGASAESIQAACASEAYTHVHILAHGTERSERYDVRFGLALHAAGDPQGPADIVSGERLATALRVSARMDSGRLSRPSVVTLASCHGGNVGSVAGVGASVAHALHAAGIPMVIASQFPLSFGGSVRLVEILYGGFLWGEDPRRVLIDLRRSLHTEFPNTHDWASITAYSSLPPDLETRLPRVQIERAMSNINVSIKLADRLTAKPTMPEDATDRLSEIERLGKMRAVVIDGRSRLEQLLRRHPSHGPRIRGYLASTEKRIASIRQRLERIGQPGGLDHVEAIRSLERARALYWEAFVGDRLAYWAVVQYLSLTLVLQAARSREVETIVERPGQEKAALWELVEVQSLGDLDIDRGVLGAWGLGNLVELYVIAPMIDEIGKRHDARELERRALGRASELVARTGADSFEVFSTRRQIVRYLEDFDEIADISVAVKASAAAVVELLPERSSSGYHY